jgi:homogentisate 1,2-dioxygenase
MHFSKMAEKKRKLDQATKNTIQWSNLSYLHGLGNSFESEALENALPKGMNNPKKCPYGLYAEQLSGTSFTTPVLKNKKAWFYRIRPSAVHLPYKPIEQEWTRKFVSDFTSSDTIITPQQLRWKPFPIPGGQKRVNFVEGIVTNGGSGSPETKTGFAVHIYACNASMDGIAFNNSDGDFLIGMIQESFFSADIVLVPQEGGLHITTEFGNIHVDPGFICVIQRGMKFSVGVNGGSRGYIAEIYQGHFGIPERGPMGKL